MTRLDRPEGRPSEVGTSADLTLIRSERPSAVALCGDAELLALRLLDAIGPAALAASAGYPQDGDSRPPSSSSQATDYGEEPF